MTKLKSFGRDHMVVLSVTCRFLWLPPPIKLIAMMSMKYCWKWR